ncbi:MAG: hypothetical protein IPL26_19735 [Leptospiraceae bacterium]|nr:hypothetical protein [Leptospiraceae bacterium]
MNETTKNFQAIANIPFIGVKEYLIPDTQRDARNSQTGKLEAHNHCKSTSSTVAWNSLGKILSPKFPILKSMETMGEFQYDAIIRNFMNPNEKIQDWAPHVRMFNDLFRQNGIPLVANFGLFRRNELQVYASMGKGFPVVLGTMITNAGHIVLLYRQYKYEGMTFHVIIDPYGNPMKLYRGKGNDVADYYVIPRAEWDKWITPVCNCIWFEVLPQRH